MDLNNLNKFLFLENLTKYPYNLNNKLKDNIIETKKEIELEYIKSYNIYLDKNKKKSGSSQQIILIY